MVLIKKTLYLLVPVFGCLCLLFARVLPGAAYAPPCVFHRLTGLYCAGCGATRAFYALAHGDIPRAFGHNALFMLLIPFAAYFYAGGFFVLFLGKKVLPLPKNPIPWLWTLLVAAVLFMVARNLPFAPFCFLKP